MKKLYQLLPLVAVIQVGVATAKPELPATAPKDPGVINKERIQYWMETRGQITAEMNEAQKQTLVDAWAARAHAGSLPGFTRINLKPEIKKIHQSSRQGDDTIKTVKVLAVTIDFPDLLHTNHGLTSNDTDMLYSSYPISHYQDLQFSTTGYAGPSGQNLISGYQYYQQESGGTFFFTGQTYGWVTADNNHAYYGGNDPDNDDSDQNVPALITEAVNKAFAANTINLADFDVEDQFDIDGDGNLGEPDGFIDHVMVYHSSVGEEAGGGRAGNNGDDAIWSHRFFVNGDASSWATSGAAIEGSEYLPNQPYRVFGYTIQPIDAAAGVVAHEFGHDLGLPDEYDTEYSDFGEPVGNWSIMSGGSWAGAVAGTQPVGFSPYAKAYFQQHYAGDWIDEIVVDSASLTTAGQAIDLVEAVNHSGTANHLTLELPAAEHTPYQGSYQYHSGSGHDLNNSMSWQVALPAGSITLTAKAHWSIEEDWDYARLLVNNTPIAGNHTREVNPHSQYLGDIRNYLTADSKNIDGAEGASGWLDLSFDLSAYAGQTVTLKFEYVTDSNTGGYGFVVDQIAIADSFSDDAEASGNATLSGFTRNQSLAGSDHRYYIQLRSHNQVDAGLATRGYDRGLVVWYENEAYGDNNVGVHPGYGFIGVVDADQVLNSNAQQKNTTYQIRDAAFSLFSQSSYTGDNHLDANPLFDDMDDYSSPAQPQSGLVLPELGINFEITNQAADSSSTTILLKKKSLTLNADFSYSRNFRTVSFSDATSGGATNYNYLWNFGDTNTSTAASPTHTYAASGVYTVTLIVTDADAVAASVSKTVTIAEPLTPSFTQSLTNATVTLNASSVGGDGLVSYAWSFGDGQTGSGVQTTHTYSASGTYTISMTASSEDNQTATVSSSVEIYIAPSAAFTVSISNLTATFVNTSSGGSGTISYVWDFGDGGSSTLSSISHTYASAGTYSVKLTMTDGQGNESTVTRSVTVTEPPSSGGGGGSFGALLLLLLPFLWRRRVSK